MRPQALITPPPLAIYVHLPWCVRKCPYCDFNSHARNPALIPEMDYIAALRADLEQDLVLLGPTRPVQSVFFGGGTPSLFSAAGIAKILHDLRGQLAFAHDAEITLEANPGTFDQARFAGYREAGVNRLSLGIQSFNDRHLKALGRVHGSMEALCAARAARELGFSRLNLDLMYGLPGQTETEALEDIDQALALNPDHLSHYQLTLEPSTPFALRPPALPQAETLWRMERRCRIRLARAGFHQYEVSAHAQPGHACRHNLNYWTFGDYLGLGAGAHGKLTNSASQQIWRTRKHAHPQRYLATASTSARLAEYIPVLPRARPLEFLMNALRLTHGFRPELYAQRTGLDPAVLLTNLSPALADGLLKLRDGSLVPTARGMALVNELLLPFLNDESLPSV